MIFQGFLRISHDSSPLDSSGFLRIPQDSSGFFWGSSGFLWIPQDSSGFLRISQDSSGYLRIPLDSSGYLKNPLESSLWIPLDSSGFLRIPQESSGFLRIPQDFSESFGGLFICNCNIFYYNYANSMKHRTWVESSAFKAAPTYIRASMYFVCSLAVHI